MTDVKSIKKVALVTGASRGIGKAIAGELAKQGVIVLGTATSEKGAEAISQDLQKYNKENMGLVLNISDSESIAKAMATVTELKLVPNILINNAGITADNLFLRMNDDLWNKVIDTNLTGVYRLTKSCIKGMLKQRWGRIINLTSVVAFSGNAGQTNYSAAKSGLIGFSKSLAQEIASRGITVNLVAPGFIATDMTGELQEQQKSELLKQIPAGRMGDTAEIAATVNFLASDLAGYITGETIHVNGGMFMH